MKKKQKHILLLNWRTPYHHSAGGAEFVSRDICNYLISLGYSVDWLSSRRLSRHEVPKSDRIHYYELTPEIEESGLALLYKFPYYIIKAFFKVRSLRNLHSYDLIIDEMHGFPHFFTLLSPKNTVLFVCEVAGKIWDLMFPPPISTIGRLMEQFVLWLYRGMTIWTISDFTRYEIQNITMSSAVKVVPLGIHLQKKISLAQTETRTEIKPIALFIGRLVKMKGVESAIRAAALVQKENTNFKLFIIGRGEIGYEHSLRQMVKDLNMTGSVFFFGNVSEKRKTQLIQQSAFLLHSSYKEGFGLTVLEAGEFGKPSIVRAGSAMDDLVVDGVNGFRYFSEDEVPKLVNRLLESKTYHILSENARKLAETRDWNKIKIGIKQLVINI